MLQLFKNRDLINTGQLLEILDQNLSPRLKARGLLWNGSYLWFDGFRNSVRRVFGYSLLKGGQGTFTWGVCLDFIPTLSGNNLRLHRTDKSVKLQLFEWTDEYAASFNKNSDDKSESNVTHWGAYNAKQSVKKLMDKYEARIFKWFDAAYTLEDVIKIAEYQVAEGKIYKFHNPDPQWILAFLYAKTKEHQKAIEIIHMLDIDETLKPQLIQKVKKL
ncbi:hypothetical protein [Niabella beijingensis]|uniref:hypothetical protein n=1 Tax=Niabella beijingensis TaxID=2872700 RepID=UPI001CBF44CD|nr:hypothetical protein [Niabella beijingensis]MBZ4191842.1 hypothetical protein [Niabella beijingensis]